VLGEPLKDLPVAGRDMRTDRRHWPRPPATGEELIIVGVRVCLEVRVVVRRYGWWGCSGGGSVVRSTQRSTLNFLHIEVQVNA
jgi:hypothetical protein